MDYINETFERMDLQKIRSFLLYGVEDFDNDDQPYKDRLKNRSEPIYSRLQSLYSDINELDQASADLSEALTAYEYVYMELGMKAGARLLYQLLLSNDHSSQDEVTTK